MTIFDEFDPHPKSYCVPCEAVWRKGNCPVCEQPGEPGRTGHEPEGWPQLNGRTVDQLPEREAS